MGPEPFGVLADGRTVHRVRLDWPGGLAVELLDYGGIVRSLLAPSPGGSVETVLGFATIAGYEADTGYQGRVIGRCANRIAGARFSIDGEVFHVAANEGESCLHGGVRGFSDRLWRFVRADDRSAALEYLSPDGEEGFPGTVMARAAFALTAADTLEIVWEAETDRPTPVNLTHHLYFNLSGDPSAPALDHTLQIAGSHVTPVFADLIPTGALEPVEATAFDLRSPRALAEILAASDPQLAIGGGVDHNWALDGGPGPSLTLACPASGLALEITTDQPGVQVYWGRG